ncbi:cytochrome b5, partial [Sodiomyces alkalinus F11]
TFTELTEHNTKEDLWVAVQGKVYQLSDFVTDHPGGIDVLLECAGIDGTETYDYAGHSDSAKVTLERYYVGDL